MSDDARTDTELTAAFQRGAKAQQDICDSEHGDAAEVDRLRAELDRHREAGDELVGALARVWNEMSEARPSGLAKTVDRVSRGWRSVRGDAPAASAVRGAVPDFGTCTPAETRFVNAVASAVADAVDGHALFSCRYRVAGAALEALRAEPGADRDRLASTIELGFRGATRDTTWRELAERAADALVETGQAPPAAPTDGQAPADEDSETPLSERVTDPDLAAACRDFEGRAPSDDVPWWVALHMYNVVAERTAAAAPADDTAAPDDLALLTSAATLLRSFGRSMAGGPGAVDLADRLVAYRDRIRQPVRDSLPRAMARLGLPCRDCPPPGERVVECGSCGVVVPTFAAVESGAVEWPTDDEQQAAARPVLDGGGGESGE